jgi:hypothetical protein
MLTGTLSLCFLGSTRSPVSASQLSPALGQKPSALGRTWSVKFPIKEALLFLLELRSRDLFQELEKCILQYVGLWLLRQLLDSWTPYSNSAFYHTNSLGRSNKQNSKSRLLLHPPGATLLLGSAALVDERGRSRLLLL